MKKTNDQIARGMLPYVTTVLSLSLAVTLRVESAMNGDPRGCSPLQPSPELLAVRQAGGLSGVMTGAEKVQRHIPLGAHDPAVVGLGRDVK